MSLKQIFHYPSNPISISISSQLPGSASDIRRPADAGEAQVVVIEAEVGEAGITIITVTLKALSFGVSVASHFAF